MKCIRAMADNEKVLGCMGQSVEKCVIEWQLTEKGLGVLEQCFNFIGSQWWLVKQCKVQWQPVKMSIGAVAVSGEVVEL